jgi:internalin A
MKPSILGALALCLVSFACDDPKDKEAADTSPAVTASAAPVASTAPTPSVTASAAPVKKKEWKCTDAPTVDFQGDDALEKEVRLKVNKPKGDVTVADLHTIKSINLTKYGPTDELNPCLFPKFTALHDLFVAKGELEDLKPLSSLTQLVSLRATDNHVSDIKALGAMGHMDRLDLSRSQVKDLTPIKSMVELTELSLDNTPVDDISALASLTKLEKVTLVNTIVKDVSPLKACKKLKLLDITGTAITDTGGLAPGLKIKRD